jgi:hypothetical protein
MSKEIQDTKKEPPPPGVGTETKPKPAARPKKPSAKAKHPAKHSSKATPEWWPAEGLVVANGCLVVRIDAETYAHLIETEKQIGVPIAKLAGSAASQAVSFLSAEARREADRLREVISSIDADDERLLEELNRRKAERFERAQAMLAMSAIPETPN